MSRRRPEYEDVLRGPRGERTLIVEQGFADWLLRSGVLRHAQSVAARGHAGRLVDATLTAFALAATETTRVPTPEPGSVPTPEPVSPSALTTQQAADRLNVTARAVTKACQDGRLNGQQDAGGRWWIDADSVTAAQTRRTA